MLISTRSDFKLESFELEINLVIGLSMMMMETWQAAKPLQGLLAEVAGGKVMFTKFCPTFVKFFSMDLGREALIRNMFSKESTIQTYDFKLTFDGFRIYILSLVREAAGIT